jgi:glycyl-tRNA synthetase alpha chain
MRRSAWGCWSRRRSLSEMDALKLKRFPVLGAYELALKCSHVFNLLDARGRSR